MYRDYMGREWEEESDFLEWIERYVKESPSHYLRMEAAKVLVREIERLREDR